MENNFRIFELIKIGNINKHDIRNNCSFIKKKLTAFLLDPTNKYIYIGD